MEIPQFKNTYNKPGIELLPHRAPFLFVDTLIAADETGAVGEYTYTNEKNDFFKGHFPGDPVLPGVYTVEATAQATDLVLMTKPAYAGKVPLFLGINNVKFRKKILPGDTLEIHAEMLTERADKAIATCKCTVYTAGDLAAESEVTIAMR